MRVIIDSTDKRMTVPLIDYLAQAGYEVHGLCFSGDRPLNRERLARTYYISRRIRLGSRRYLPNMIPMIPTAGRIEAVNSIKPRLKYLLAQESAESRQ